MLIQSDVHVRTGKTVRPHDESEARGSGAKLLSQGLFFHNFAPG